MAYPNRSILYSGKDIHHMDYLTPYSLNPLVVDGTLRCIHWEICFPYFHASFHRPF